MNTFRPNAATSIKSKCGCSIRGRYKIAVLQDGVEISSRDWRPNLLLNQGLDRLGSSPDQPDLVGVPFADLFKWAARGTGDEITKEEVTGSYTLSGGGVVTRTSGARDFTADDVGKLLRRSTTPFNEAMIVSFTNATTIDVEPVGTFGVPGTFTTEPIELYSVSQVGLEAELGARTDTYSQIAGENGTTDGTAGNANKRTLKRTFLFPEEGEVDEVVTGTYSQTTTVVTRVTGARDFTADDETKYIKFADNTVAKITNFTSATTVTVDRSATVAAQAITLYGYVTYGELGFSDVETAGDNLCIRVRLQTGGGVFEPIQILGANPETSGQQLKVTYEMEISVFPNAVTATSAADISDPDNSMSSNKNGTAVVEALALSVIDADGGTDISAASLEPFSGGSIGLSPSTAALVAIGDVDRGDGAEYVEMTPVAYVDGTYTRVYEGRFELNDAIATNWKIMGIYDPDTETFPFAWRFAVNQSKSGENSLTLRFRKTWNRDLS